MIKTTHSLNTENKFAEQDKEYVLGSLKQVA